MLYLVYSTSLNFLVLCFIFYKHLFRKGKLCFKKRINQTIEEIPLNNMTPDGNQGNQQNNQQNSQQSSQHNQAYGQLLNNMRNEGNQANQNQDVEQEFLRRLVFAMNPRTLTPEQRRQMQQNREELYQRQQQNRRRQIRDAHESKYVTLHSPVPPPPPRNTSSQHQTVAPIAQNQTPIPRARNTPLQEQTVAQLNVRLDRLNEQTDELNIPVGYYRDSQQILNPIEDIYS
jgi:hypothetical protein